MQVNRKRQALNMITYSELYNRAFQLKGNTDLFNRYLSLKLTSATHSISQYQTSKHILTLGRTQRLGEIVQCHTIRQAQTAHKLSVLRHTAMLRKLQHKIIMHLWRPGGPLFHRHRPEEMLTPRRAVGRRAVQTDAARGEGQREEEEPAQQAASVLPSSSSFGSCPGRHDDWEESASSAAHVGPRAVAGESSAPSWQHRKARWSAAPACGSGSYETPSGSDEPSRAMSVVVPDQHRRLVSEQRTADPLPVGGPASSRCPGLSE